MAKKYIKGIIGGSINEAIAAGFLHWFAENREDVIACIKLEIDEDLITDAMLNVYDAIALKGHTVNDFKGYYLMTYRNAYYAAKRDLVETEDVKDVPVIDAEIITPTIDAEFREAVLDFVRDSYDTISVSIFEMYAILYPQSKKKGIAEIAELTGLPRARISETLEAIKRDLRDEFGARYQYFLSQY